MKKGIIYIMLLSTVLGVAQKSSKTKLTPEEDRARMMANVEQTLAFAETTIEEYRVKNVEENRISKEMALFGTKSVPNGAYIEPLLVRITHDVTVSIIFPSKIKTIDRGVELIQGKKVDGVENVLKLKAEKPFDRPSNLTVITEDGKIYVYTVVYEVFTTDYAIDMNKISSNGNIKSTSYNANVLNTETNDIKFEGSGMNSEEIAQLSDKILHSNYTIVDRENEANISLLIRKIFVKDDIIFIPVQILNGGDLNYDIELIKFFSEDKKEIKRTVKQVMELEPVYVHNETDVVTKNSAKTQIFAFSKFTITKDKYFKVVLYEKNGGRNVTCKLKYKDINKAKYID
jgi:conjugative transposon TraN protein